MFKVVWHDIDLPKFLHHFSLVSVVGMMSSTGVWLVWFKLFFYNFNLISIYGSDNVLNLSQVIMVQKNVVILT